jgi:hypothetical protein
MGDQLRWQQVLEHGGQSQFFDALLEIDLLLGWPLGNDYSG